MLTGKNVVFLGGDARQLEVIKSCIQMHAQVTLIGYDNLQTPLSGAMQKELTEENLKTVDILVLPIVGVDEKGHVMSVFTSKELVLHKEYVEALPQHTLVFSGIATPYLKNLCQAHKIQLIELMNRNDVAIYNSIPTVEGALMMAIQNTDITIHGSMCIVLGFGRVGMSLSRTLQAIGARVKVGTRESEDMARAFEMSLQPFDIRQLADEVGQAEVIFNTVPALIMDESVLEKVRHDVLIIDLASKPGGVDYAFAKKRGIQAILAPSLPGVVAPKTAGKILARTITELMSHSLGGESDGL